MDFSEVIVVFSHLRWNFVYQRPQHLFSRLAAKWRVIFIEEPVHAPGEPYWEFTTPVPNVTIARPHTPIAEPGFSDAQIEALYPLMEALKHTAALSNAIAWLYTPLALPLAQGLQPRLSVYDCMDELSLFLHAPPQLRTREAELFQWVDVVFTGGPSLYRAKQGQHANLHCFPSSVEVAHFQQARPAPAGGCLAAPEQAFMAQPRLGFYGVIDERLDLALLEAVARTHAQWQIVMVGPVTKIDLTTLPRYPNLHYLGQRAYEQLPAYLSGWDVCLLPFACNAATRFISPTKTLEYMAAERPIVSTPIADVANLYGDIVYLGDTPQAFIQACEQALAAPAAERLKRVARMRAVLAQTSWDTTVTAMTEILAETLAKRVLERRKDVGMRV